MRLRASVREALDAHGLAVADADTPALLKERLNDLYLEDVRRLKARAPAGLALVGTAYSYLQEYLPHVAQRVVREGWTDLVGLGRMTLSYPTLLTDAARRGKLENKFICRTFSDCTTAPRNGLVSGCYPLDDFYKSRPAAQELKQVKKSAGV